MADFDAIVVGSGPNGLVCALSLVRAGWKVLVLEKNPQIGGGMRTAEITLPGFKHDLYSSNLGRFSLSPLYQEIKDEFDEFGVRFCTSDYPFASVYPEGRAACAYKDPEQLHNHLFSAYPKDVGNWNKILGLYQRIAPNFLPLLRVTIPSGAMAKQIGRLATSPIDAFRLLRIGLQSPRQFADQHFNSPELKGLVSPWSLHSDYGADIRGGAVVPFFFAFNSQQQGLWVAEGGAGNVSAAMHRLIERYGGTVLAGTAATKIIARQGAATAVETSEGQTYSASRAIIGNLSPKSMFGQLVDYEDLPPAFASRIQKFRYGIGTFIVHMALSRPLQWLAGPDVTRFNTVHVGGDIDSLALGYHQAMERRLIPERPLLILNQLTATDPTRAPEGQAIVRIHARPFPAQIAGDAAGRITATDWDNAKEAVADRLLDQLSEHAPNVKEVLLARHIASPLDLQRDNPNWVGGDCGSGSNHLDQNYFLRPVRGWTRYQMPLDNLYMIGSSTWPSGGTHGMSGYLLSQRLINSA